MRETEGMSVASDATVEEACPVCAGPLVVRASGGRSWAYCQACHRLSRSVLLPGPAGETLMVHQLAAA